MKGWLAALLCAGLVLTRCSAGGGESDKKKTPQPEVSAGSQSEPAPAQPEESDSAGEAALSEETEPEDDESMDDEPQVPPSRPNAVELDPGEPGSSQAAAVPLRESDAVSAVIPVGESLEAGEYRILAEHLHLREGDRIHLELQAGGSGKLEWGLLAQDTLPDSADTRYYMGQRDIDGERVAVSYLKAGETGGYQVQGFPLPDELVFYVYNLGDGALVLEGEVRLETP